eukprot:Em0003g351a
MWRVRLGLHPFGGRAGDLKLSVVSLDLQIYGRLNLTLIRANSRTILSRIQLGDRQFLALVREAGFGSVTNLYLCSAVADFNSAVPPDKALQIHSLLSASLVSQKELSSTLDTCMFNLLLETSSNADQARLLSVSAPHASSWLSVLPSQGLGLHLDAPVHEVAIKWWLGMDTSQGSQCALCPGNALTLWDIMPPLVSVAVMWWYELNTLCDVLAETCHPGPSKWKLAMTPQPIIATPILLTFC